MAAASASSGAQYAVPVLQPNSDHESAIYRSTCSPHKLLDQYEGVGTLYENFM